LAGARATKQREKSLDEGKSLENFDFLGFHALLHGDST